MNKYEFLEELRGKLRGIPLEDIYSTIDFYSEMIDDRVEDGMTIEEAIKEIGTPDEIAKEIFSTIPLKKLVKEKVRPKHRLRFWEMLFIVLGSPVWLSVLISMLSIVLSIYIVLWSVVLTFICVDITFFASTLALFTGAVGMMISSYVPEGIMLIGAGLVMGALSLFTMLFVKVLIKGTVWLSKQIIILIKRMFMGKGDDNEKID